MEVFPFGRRAEGFDAMDDEHREKNRYPQAIAKLMPFMSVPPHLFLAMTHTA